MHDWFPISIVYDLVSSASQSTMSQCLGFLSHLDASSGYKHLKNSYYEDYGKI